MFLQLQGLEYTIFKMPNGRNNQCKTFAENIWEPGDQKQTFKA